MKTSANVQAEEATERAPEAGPPTQRERRNGLRQRRVRSQQAAKPPLGPKQWAQLEGWGMAVASTGFHCQPRTVEEIRAIFDLAADEGLAVALHGGGRSYGDASIGKGSVMLDLSAMNRILAWDPETGRAELEPGVTLRQLWQHIIADGWWPAVVSGTMFTTVGGCAAMNIHGKNNYRVGPFGDHILEFDLLLPTGELVTCSRERRPDLFHAAISGFGMLGCFTRIVLQTKKVYSGQLSVEAFSTRNLREMIEEFEERYDESDYLVGWLDCTASGGGLGRGIVHQANSLQPGQDPRPEATLNVGAQELPDRLFGFFPKSLMWMLLGPFVNNAGMRLVNLAKYYSSFLMPRGHRYLQSHGGFHFLLDYVPNWKFAYRPGGLIQYQCFIPKAHAVRVFETLIRMAQRAGLPSYLGVVKKHRPDPFLLTHAVDGYSLALDFRVTEENRERLWELTHRMDDVVLEAGGRFYFAKDATLRPEVVNRFFPKENLQEFLRLKEACDPENLLQTDLSRRVLEPLRKRKKV